MHEMNVDQNSYNIGFENGFKEGMSEAWQIARKIFLEEKEGGINKKALQVIFERVWYSDILRDYSAEDAKRMIEEYQEKCNIKEGDIVEIIGQEAVVLAIDKDIASLYVLTDANAKVQEVKLDKLKKTGCSIDVAITLVGACFKAKAAIEKGSAE